MITTTGNRILTFWFMLAGINALGSDASKIGSIELHSLAHLSRHGQSLIISGSKQQPITITSSGMDLSGYEFHNYFGDQDQFPIAIVVEDHTLIFYHAAFVDTKIFGGRSSLSIPLNGNAPTFASLCGGIKKNSPIWIIDKNLNIKMDGTPFNLADSSTQLLEHKHAKATKKAKRPND